MDSYPLWVWLAFNVFLLALLAVDLLAHRRAHVVGIREALLWSAGWIGLALLFNAGLWYARGPGPALEFLTGYLIEKSLSVDNLFVFALLFSFLGVPGALQHRVLFWGILGALVMRLAFILAGVALLERFHGLIYVFGAILIVSGIRMWSHAGGETDLARNPVLRFLRRVLPVTEGFEGGHFLVRRGGRRWATPLLVALLMVEATDLLFAVDSIPAVLAVTRDPFIVYSSNAFAILGLRALYFALSGVMQLFHHLHHGLSATLVFVGLKMVASDLWRMPVGLALAVIALILGTSIVTSLLDRRAPERQGAGGV